MAADVAMQEVGSADAAAGLPLSEPQQWDVLGRLEKGAVGVRDADGTVRAGVAETAGCLLYGPYWQLAAGVYRLTFACRIGAPRYRAQPVLGVEIILLNRVQHAWRDFTAEELAAGGGEVLFDVPEEVSREARNEGRFEFRFFHFGNADIAVTAIRLAAAEIGEAPPPADRTWRMLGRLQKSLKGRRRTDGAVTVGRLAAPGCLLYGGWPYLRLARGRYRLVIGGRSGVPREAGQPVLAAEVIAPSRWRDRGTWHAAFAAGAPRAGERVWRQFTADELNSGGAAVEFAVPTELSLDSGTDAPFELRLFHLGSAGLTIDAVDLHRIGDGAASGPLAASLPAPALHPLGRKNIVIIGNCQSEIVRQGFTRVDSLNAQFNAAYHFVTLPPNLIEFARRDLEACDILLVQDIRDWENFPLRDAVPPGVATIRFPGVRLASLWPFDGWNGPGDNDAQRREAPNLTFAYLDGLLARLRREIPDREQRFHAYRALDCPGVVNYRRLHEFEERRLIAMDQKFGIAIGAAILDQFRQRRVFHTTVRPNRQLLDMLMQYILKTIGVRGRHRLPEHVEALLRDPQVPVHPKVARDLGVAWADETTRYLHRGREITWESYIRSYIEHYG